MQCNGDMRHVIEILAILSATVVFYRETKNPQVTSKKSGRAILDLINTPLGWALMNALFLIVALPAYLYFDKKYKKVALEASRQRPLVPEGNRLLLKTTLVFLLSFYLTYKQ